MHDLGGRVRALLELGDGAEWEKAMEFFAADAVWATVGGLEDHEGSAIRDFWVAWYEPYEDVRIEILDVVDPGGGVVIAVIRQSGRLGSVAKRVSEQIALVYEWSSGLIARVTVYVDLGEGRAAAERLATERG